MKRRTSPLRMKMETRLQCELAVQRQRVEQLFEKAKKEIRSHPDGQISDATMTALHEAEQVVAALERVDGCFYQRIKDGIAEERAEREREAAESAAEIIAAVRPRDS